MIVAAAGNDSRQDRRAPVSSPLSAAHRVISVSAAENGESGYRVAAFSNSLPTLCAPGTGVLSAHPGRGLRSLTGTSMACAHAAGVAALWWEYLRSARPAVEITSRMVVDAMLKATRPDVFAPEVPDFDRGAGLIQAPLSGEGGGLGAATGPHRRRGGSRGGSRDQPRRRLDIGVGTSPAFAGSTAPGITRRAWGAS